MKADPLSKILLLSSSIVISGSLGDTSWFLHLREPHQHSYNFAISDLQRSADTLSVRLVL